MQLSSAFWFFIFESFVSLAPVKYIFTYSFGTGIVTLVVSSVGYRRIDES